MVAPTPTRGRGGRGSRGGRARGGRWANHWATRTAPARAARASSPRFGRSSSLAHHYAKAFPPHLLRAAIPGQAGQDHLDTAQSSTTITTAQQNPETPLRRRSKRALAVPESSRTTRQSARQSVPGRQSSRLKPGDAGLETPSKGESEEVSEQDDDFADDASMQKEEEEDEDFKPQQRLKLQVSQSAELLDPVSAASASASTPTRRTSPIERETRLATKLQDNETLRPESASAYSASAPTAPFSQDAESDSPKQSQSQSQPLSRGMSSPRPSRKRKSTDKDESADIDRAVSEPASKKPKMEDEEEMPPAPLANGTELGSQIVTSPDEAADPDSARGGAIGPIRSTAVVRARGRGRGRARASAAAKGRGGKRIEDEIWDSDSRRRSPSPIPQTKPIKDRQEELALLFKKVGQAQQVALSVLADHSMAKIAREKGAHMECPEFGLVQRELAEYERKALTRFRDDYDLKVEAENKVYAGEIHLIETRANEQLENIQDEMFHAARGKYMELVLGRRAAEDDEHTETDGSDPDAEEPQYLFRIGKAGTREVERGFFAEAVREPDGAAAYDRGRRTWDDFVQKVRLGEDLNPQMQALDSIMDPAVQDHVTRTLTNLLQAAQVVADGGLDGAIDWPTPKALSMLADTALAEPMQTHLPRMDPTMSPASRHLIPTSGIRAPSSSPVQHRHNNRAASSPPEANWVYQIHSQ
ncbi:hypothetical protein N7533_008575 [Penicillium manginii]|uniref:uncharacterized protein n=1 Tax=Penicillium manginii TaxID=203109 RepID=UPI0025485F09|nr:uncharacterized protein N7533_008575 [Penicillium manginii]KAJ5743705.1 hypothetical protein N7533_008575 [Penicillium manginii]